MMRYLCLWLICFMLGRKFHVKYKRKRTAENFVYHFRVHGILIFCFLYFGWLCFLINNNSDSLCQLKYKHRFMSAIYFDWIPICFINAKTLVSANKILVAVSILQASILQFLSDVKNAERGLKVMLITSSTIFVTFNKNKDR